MVAKTFLAPAKAGSHFDTQSTAPTLESVGYGSYACFADEPEFLFE
ncbi:MAG TPA: hypothetical protein VGQ46_17480 [Thermoanaerobaculia bacterium]|jgi:hypothetical protein|nr:hypothetical protein [Thermoanaerobaculia bacterium]